MDWGRPFLTYGESSTSIQVPSPAFYHILAISSVPALSHILFPPLYPPRSFHHSDYAGARFELFPRLVLHAWHPSHTLSMSYILPFHTELSFSNIPILYLHYIPLSKKAKVFHSRIFLLLLLLFLPRACLKNHSRDLHSPQIVKHISRKAFFKHALERTNLDCFGIFLQKGTPGKRMCLPWLRPFQNAKNP